MRWIIPFLIILGSSWVTASPSARAAGDPAACRHAATIVDLARFVIDGPPDQPRFWHNRYGDDAAYLAIRYGGVSYQAASAMLQRLDDGGHRAPRIDELRLAFANQADNRALVAFGQMRLVTVRFHSLDHVCNLLRRSVFLHHDDHFLSILSRIR